MAYMSQEKKAKLAPAIKEILKKYGLKGSLSVNNYSTLVLKITAGKIDFISNYNETAHARYPNRMKEDAKDSLDINTYWFHEVFTGDALNALTEIIAAMNVGNHNNSDVQTDYFDVGWYVDVNVGTWNKPYKLVKE